MLLLAALAITATLAARCFANMSICSLEFVGALLAASAVFFWLPTLRLRQGFLALANAAFLYTLVPDATSWTTTGLFVLGGYVVARLLQVYRRRWLLAGYIALLLGIFLVVKRYDFLSALLPASLFSHKFVIVGLSYLLFRQVHMAVDALEGQIERLSLWTCLNYQLNLFGLLAGPIQRYHEFEESWHRLEPIAVDTHEVLRTWCRIFSGIVKVVLLAAASLGIYERFADYFAEGVHSPPLGRAETLARFLAMLYAYPAYVYFNFSGYCDVVIGGSRLLGMKMPENFDWPFLSRNMIEYWTRFHKTLGRWIRDYLFTPMYKALVRRWPERANLAAVLCYFVAFLLAGIWHGPTSNYFVFGFLNGAGVASVKIWEIWLTRRFGRQGLRRYMQSKPVHSLAVALNFHYVCLCIFFFPADLGRIVRIVESIVAQLA